MADLVEELISEEASILKIYLEVDDVGVVLASKNTLSLSAVVSSQHYQPELLSGLNKGKRLGLQANTHFKRSLLPLLSMLNPGGGGDAPYRLSDCRSLSIHS